MIDDEGGHVKDSHSYLGNISYISYAKHDLRSTGCSAKC